MTICLVNTYNLLNYRRLTDPDDDNYEMQSKGAAPPDLIG